MTESLGRQDAGKLGEQTDGRGELHTEEGEKPSPYRRICDETLKIGGGSGITVGNLFSFPRLRGWHGISRGVDGQLNLVMSIRVGGSRSVHPQGEQGRRGKKRHS